MTRHPSGPMSTVRQCSSARSRVDVPGMLGDAGVDGAVRTVELSLRFKQIER
jgi:hypothetical protein